MPSKIDGHPLITKAEMDETRSRLLQHAGAVWARRLRATNGWVTCYEAKPAGIDADSKYVLVCERHGTILEVSSLKLADVHGPSVKDWCQRCGCGGERSW